MDYSSTSNTKNSIRITLIVTIAGFVMVYAGIYFLMPLSRHIKDVCLSSLYVLSVLLVFVTCVWAAINTVAYKRLWRLMSIGTFSWLLGVITASIYVIKMGPKDIPVPSLADAFSVAYVPMLLGMMISLGRIRAPFDIEKKQFIVNVSMVALAMLMVFYKFLIIPLLETNPHSTLVDTISVVLYPITDWTIFVLLLFVSRRLWGNQFEGWVAFLIAAFTFCLSADIYDYIAGYVMNPFSMLAMSCAAMMISLSAIDEVSGKLIGIHEVNRYTNDSLSMALRVSPWRSLWIPLLTAAVVPGIWIISGENIQDGETTVFGVISALILFLLIYRNHLLVSDNALLIAKTLRDSLTGLNNHRYFQESLSRNITKARKSRKPLSLLILDIDNFSIINNKYGHKVGDRILSIVGNVIAQELGESDEACRLNSDEFGILMPATRTYHAKERAEDLKIKILDSVYKAFPNIDMTISIGISEYPNLAKNKDNLILTSEGSLYWAKLNGKNQILTYNPKIVKVLSADERAKKAEEVALTDMVRSLASAVDARDSYTQKHSRGVSELAKRLAVQLGADDKIINTIEVAGVLHDVGKIGVPDQILNKPGKLTDEEMAIIKNHPTISAEILRSTSLKDIIPAVRSHHERWDGNGYPQGLKGEEIPMEARILAICDTFDAMTTDRPYRDGLTIDVALNEIQRCAGSQFDPNLVDEFVKMFDLSNVKSISSREENLTSEDDTPTITELGEAG